MGILSDCIGGQLAKQSDIIWQTLLINYQTVLHTVFFCTPKTESVLFENLSLKGKPAKKGGSKEDKIKLPNFTLDKTKLGKKEFEYCEKMKIMYNVSVREVRANALEAFR